MRQRKLGAPLAWAVSALMALSAAIVLWSPDRADAAGFYNEANTRVVYELCPRRSSWLIEVCEYVTVAPGSGQSTNGRGGRIKSVRIATMSEPPWLFHVYSADCYIDDFGYAKLIVTGPQSIRLDVYTEQDERRDCPLTRQPYILN